MSFSAHYKLPQFHFFLCACFRHSIMLEAFFKYIVVLYHILDKVVNKRLAAMVFGKIDNLDYWSANTHFCLPSTGSRTHSLSPGTLGSAT